MPTILITGGTGLVGKHLSRQLIDKGYDVAVLSTSRQPNSDIPTYFWDIDKNEIDIKAIENADYLIHLAGANIGKKTWINKRKQQIIDSRVKSAQLIFNKIKENKNQLKAFISASAIGYYGAITDEKIFSEADTSYNDFLGNTCREWEKSCDSFDTLGIRTVKIRTGVVLTKQGGALAKMITPIKLGIGSAIGSGKQFMPWIHIDDLCGIYLKAIADEQMRGAYNAVAPEHATNREFMSTLAQALKKPFWFPNVPSMAMKLMFGEMSLMLLQVSRVSSDKIREAGYDFRFPNLKDALKNLF